MNRKLKPERLLSTGKELQERYEQLRRHVLQPFLPQREWSGLGVFLNQGMRSWMETMSSHASFPDWAAAGSKGFPSETAAREVSASRELRQLLADMVLKNQGFPSRRILRHQVCQENNVSPIGLPSSEPSVHNDL